ncbi:hypothetical protein B0I35DRAFT_454762 [Stachybotrys elegans]|uniref:Fumarylacetoacetase n=1 Tax=Stachybotrys elegans TaxID=80388 RepID=A0A8K0SEG9_9HYPO|nr:hypothetical protein B0I35DRAFT_454762 [Stachybotrys elegans]
MATNPLLSGDSRFTIDNIPFGVISTKQDPTPRCAAAIGDFAIDLAKFAGDSRLDSIIGQNAATDIFSKPCLNSFAALERETRRAVRAALQLDIQDELIPPHCLVKLADVTMHLPFSIGGYSDFYCSLEHVQNCSPLAGVANIPESWFYAPSVYNGRVSSVVPSATPIRRPRGVYHGPDGKPVYGPSRALDFELEMGVFVSKPIDFASVLDIRDVEEHVFGFVLLNDWSARDLQVFEMKPLGPFHGKGFGTSISPWVVTMEALDPFKCSPKTKQNPAPFDHLKWPGPAGTFDINLEVELIRAGKVVKICSSNLRYLYWTPYQQLAHHASAGCGLSTGDLIGTGTISGDNVAEDGRKTELGCLFEATVGGTKEAELSDGTRMTYLEDGDEIVLKGTCGVKGGSAPFVDFGECRGIITPALSS